MEITDSPDLPARRLHSVKESGFLSRIAGMCKWLRLSVAALGLLAAPQAGCVHVPKPAPHSELEPDRQICIAWASSKDGDIVVNNFGSVGTIGEYINVQVRELLSAELKKYFSERFANVQIQDLGFQRIERLSLYDGSKSDKGSPFEEYIRNNSGSFIVQGCDDAIGIEMKAWVRRNYVSRVYRDPNDYVELTARATIINLESDSLISDIIGTILYRKKRDRCDSGDDYNRCIEKNNIPIEELLTDPFGLQGDIDDLIEDELLRDYHPEQLPALSLAKIIDVLYSRVAGTDEPLDDSGLKRLDELCQLFLSRLPHDIYADKAKSILEDIRTRPERHQQRLRREQERAQREQERAQVARKLQNSVEAAILIADIQAAREADRQLRYDDRNTYYFRALDAWRALQHKYRRANILMPDNLVRLGREAEVTCAMISRPDDGRPPGPGDAITEGLKLLGESIVESLPQIAEGMLAVANLFELSEKEKAELRRQGRTAELELRIVEVGWFDRIPQENIEITLRSLDSGSRQTYKTSKEGVLQSGGIVRFFFLRPGYYEITSPVMKEPLLIKAEDGKNVADIDLY